MQITRFMKSKLIKNFVNLGLLGAIPAVSFAIALSSGQANAIPYETNTVYKATDNSNTVVVFSGTVGSRIAVGLGSTDRPTARLADSCGTVRISPPTSGSYTGLEVDGTAVDAATLPVQSLPTCLNGTLSEARAANFKTPNNQVVIVGKTANSAVTISLPTAVTRSVTINACGFGVLRPSTGSTLPSTFSVGTTNYTVASLANATNIPVCRTVGGTSYGYVPASWLP